MLAAVVAVAYTEMPTVVAEPCLAVVVAVGDCWALQMTGAVDMAGPSSEGNLAAPWINLAY